MNPGISWLILGALTGLIVSWLWRRGDDLTDLTTSAVAETEWDSHVAQAIAIAERDAHIRQLVSEMVAEVDAEIEADEFAAQLTDTAIHNWIGDAS